MKMKRTGSLVAVLARSLTRAHERQEQFERQSVELIAPVVMTPVVMTPIVMTPVVTTPVVMTPVVMTPVMKTLKTLYRT